MLSASFGKDDTQRYKVMEKDKYAYVDRRAIIIIS